MSNTGIVHPCELPDKGINLESRSHLTEEDAEKIIELVNSALGEHALASRYFEDVEAISDFVESLTELPKRQS